MQMAKYSLAFNITQLYILNLSLKKKKQKSTNTLICDYKSVNVQTSSSSVSLQYGKYEKAFLISPL